MTRNRSVPDADVIPVLAYPDVDEAADWLVRAFGFRVRLRIGGHRAQLTLGNGAVILVQGTDGGVSAVHVRVDDVDAHHARALAAGAAIQSSPETFEFEGAPGHVSLEKLVLEDVGGGRTRVRMHSVYQSVEARDEMVASGMETGLNHGFARLDTLLESLKSPVH